MKNKMARYVIGILIIAVILGVETYIWLSNKPVGRAPDLNTDISDRQKDNKNGVQKPPIVTIPGEQNNGNEIFGAISGFKAPDFELSNMKDQKVKLSEFKGKLVLLTFWRAGSIDSEEQLVKLVQLDNAKERPEDLVILAVNYRDNKDSVSKALAKKQYKFDILLDQDQKAAEEYKISTLPTTFLIDGNGVIDELWTSLVDEQEFMAKINAIKEE